MLPYAACTIMTLEQLLLQLLCASSTKPGLDLSTMIWVAHLLVLAEPTWFTPRGQERYRVKPAALIKSGEAGGIARWRTMLQIPDCRPGKPRYICFPCSINPHQIMDETALKVTLLKSSTYVRPALVPAKPGLVAAPTCFRPAP